MGRVIVKDYNKENGTHVRRHSRDDPRPGGSSEEPNPEDKYDVEATVTADMDNKGNLENTKVSEIKMKPKGGDQNV